MDKRTPNVQSISWFMDLHRRGMLNVRPAYQRHPVWSKTYKQEFIETILRDLPAPLIILHSTVNPNGDEKFEVVDGQQRLLTIFNFVAGKEDFSPSDTWPSPYTRKRFEAFLPQEKTRFFQYQLNVQTLQNASEQELRDVFNRLNKNVSKLNRQELRHAIYAGAFVSLVTQLADDEFWQASGVITAAKIRRMLDIELVSELLVLTMHGIQEGSDEILDNYYREYEEEVPGAGQQIARFQQCKDMISRLDITKGTRYKNIADFYSLWAVCLHVLDRKRTINFSRTKNRLLAFAAEVDQKPGPTDPQAAEYLVAARQGSNKASNRELRRDVLLEHFALRK